MKPLAGIRLPSGCTAVRLQYGFEHPSAPPTGDVPRWCPLRDRHHEKSTGWMLTLACVLMFSGPGDPRPSR